MVEKCWRSLERERGVVLGLNHSMERRFSFVWYLCTFLMWVELAICHIPRHLPTCVNIRKVTSPWYKQWRTSGSATTPGGVWELRSPFKQPASQPANQPTNITKHSKSATNYLCSIFISENFPSFGKLRFPCHRLCFPPPLWKWKLFNKGRTKHHSTDAQSLLLWVADDT